MNKFTLITLLSLDALTADWKTAELILPVIYSPKSADRFESVEMLIYAKNILFGQIFLSYAVLVKAPVSYLRSSHARPDLQTAKVGCSISYRLIAKSTRSRQTLSLVPQTLVAPSMLFTSPSQIPSPWKTYHHTPFIRLAGAANTEY